MLKYIELKSGYNDNGPAWIARVQVSRSGRTVYFNGKALKRAGGIAGNHYDADNGEEYWVSGIKKNALDRHWAGSGLVGIEAAAVSEYLRLVGATQLDSSKFKVIGDLEEPDPSKFHDLENMRLGRRSVAEQGAAAATRDT
jgi:hypothetical protein